MLAVLDSLNAHNLPIFQQILLILVPKFMVLSFIELFLIKHTYH